MSFTQFPHIIESEGNCTDASPWENNWTIISIRITKDLIEEINLSRKPRIGVSRNLWVLESIQEKLKKEKINEKS